jgi:hypothetical protein
MTNLIVLFIILIYTKSINLEMIFLCAILELCIFSMYSNLLFTYALYSWREQMGAFHFVQLCVDP